MKARKAREKAKDILQDAIAIAYYKLEGMDLTEDEAEAIINYINQYGKAACKAFGREYVTY